MKNLLFFGVLIVMNNIHSQEIRHFNLTQNYNKVITYEVQGLSESDLIIANALFFNGRLNEEQKNLIKNPYDYPKDVWNPLNQYVQKISNSSEYQNCRTSDVNYQRPVIIGEKTIDVSQSEMGAWGVGHSSNDEITYHLKINIENEKVLLSIDEGQYARTIQITNDTETERRKHFDQMFNKKGEIRKILSTDGKVIEKAINNSISIYFNFIECFKNKKEKVDSEYSNRFNKQLKEDSLAQLKADSLAKIINIYDIPDHYLDQGCRYYFTSYTGDNDKDKIQELQELFNEDGENLNELDSETYELITKNSSSCIAFAGNIQDYLMVINEEVIFFPEGRYEGDGYEVEIYEGDGYKVKIELNFLHRGVNHDDIDIAKGTMTIINDFGGELKKEIFRICGR